MTRNERRCHDWRPTHRPLEFVCAICGASCNRDRRDGRIVHFAIRSEQKDEVTP